MHAFLINLANRQTDRQTDKRTRAKACTASFVGGNKISARSLALLIFAIGWAMCGRPQPGHESMTHLLSFSLLSV